MWGVVGEGEGEGEGGGWCACSVVLMCGIFLPQIAIGIICEEGISETQCWKVMQIFWTTERCVCHSVYVRFCNTLP